MNFDTPWDEGYWMESNKAFCGFNMPPALADEDKKHTLPPYKRRKSFLVDEYPACPPEWMRSEGRLTSFFVPVKEGSGMWLDFNKNADHTHELAIVISVQGVNPITGMPCTDVQLEQYIDECPKHKEKFGPNRFCKTCGYNWPKQNYISTTGTPNGYLWLDGFRSAEGVVRQYIMTAEKMRGVASNVIGKERVYAVGISFFLSKDKKVTQAPTGLRGVVSSSSISFLSASSQSGWQNRVSNYLNCCDSTPDNDLDTVTAEDLQNGAIIDINTNLTEDAKAYAASNNIKMMTPQDAAKLRGGKGTSCYNGVFYGKPQFFSPVHSPVDWKRDKDSRSKTKIIARRGGCSSIESASSESLATPQEIEAIQRKLAQTQNDPNLTIITSHELLDSNMTAGDFSHITAPVQTKKVEIGAGANIDQQVHDDPETLDYWRNEPESIIIVNYCTEEDCEKILLGGRVKQNSHPEGFLQSIPVGNKKETVNA